MSFLRQLFCWHAWVPEDIANQDHRITIGFCPKCEKVRFVERPLFSTALFLSQGSDLYQRVSPVEGIIPCPGKIGNYFINGRPAHGMKNGVCYRFKSMTVQAGDTISCHLVENCPKLGDKTFVGMKDPRVANTFSITKNGKPKFLKVTATLQTKPGKGRK